MANGLQVTPNRRGARSRELVLDAAERLMAERGYEAATVAGLVEEAGIPPSSVYHYFGSKDGVLLAVMERGAERFFADLGRPGRRQGRPVEHLRAALTATAEALDRHPDFLRLLIGMAAQPPATADGEVLAVVNRVRDLALVRLREQAAIAFDLDADGEVAGRLSRFALAAIDGAFIAQQADRSVELSEVLAQLPDALVAMRRKLVDSAA